MASLFINDILQPCAKLDLTASIFENLTITDSGDFHVTIDLTRSENILLLASLIAQQLKIFKLETRNRWLCRAIKEAAEPDLSYANFFPSELIIEQALFKDLEHIKRKSGEQTVPELNLANSKIHQALMRVLIKTRSDEVQRNLGGHPQN